MAFNRFYNCKNGVLILYNCKVLKLFSLLRLFMTCGLYYKHITIVNDNSSIINKGRVSLTDDS